jgi:diguanylate cyclase (GGDEF)-like protein/PAS domain S-box-containing protein
MSARLLEDFTEISCDWFWEMDDQFKFSYFSYRWRELFGRSPEQEIGKSRLEVAMNADDKAFWQPHIEDLHAHRPFRDLVYPYRFDDGQIRWLKISGQPVLDERGLFTGYRGVGTDITEEYEAKRRLSETLAELQHTNRAFTLVNSELQRQNRRLAEQENEIRQQRQQLDAALNNMSHGLCMFDDEFRLIVSNARYVELMGLSPGFIKPGMGLREILELNVEIGNLPPPAEHHYQAYLNELKEHGALAFERTFLDGRTIAIKHHARPDGGWVATYEDVTQRKRADARILQLARQDALTDLPNRRVFGEKVEEALARVRRGDTLTVFFLDLDNFKTVNDTLGHSAGDMLLQTVARRLQDCVRETDTVARLGGDEFAVLLDGLMPDESRMVADRILHSLRAAYDVDGHEVVIGASIGMASAPHDAEDAETLLKSADMALYRAKEEGRGIWRPFVPAMNAQLQEQRVLELDLRRAVERGEFELHYQPLLAAQSEEITGFEALLRWSHPERGLVSPADFIPLAENTGLIRPLGEWVIEAACAEAASWPEHLKVAVNLSPAHFRNKSVGAMVNAALEKSGLAPRRLELEITESALLHNSDDTRAALHELRRLGVRIVMDDFGTGYSSLSYLRSFPFDRLKIDRTFVQDLDRSADCIAIFAAMAGLGRSLGIATTAEGVETAHQLQIVRDLGCSEVQGFLFGRPRPASCVPELLALPGMPPRIKAA